MLSGYEAFGKNRVDSQSGRTALEAMRKISRVMGSLITAQEEAAKYIQAEQKDAYTEWNDVIDKELLVVLDSALCAIASAKNGMMSAQVRLNDCIQRRIDFLCSLNEIMTGDGDDEKCEARE